MTPKVSGLSGRVQLALSVLLLVTIAHPALAQSPVPSYEAFGGFSYLPADGNDFPRQNSDGFQVSLAANINPWFSLVADLGGQYSSAANLGFNFPGVTAKTSAYEYLFGPRFTGRGHRVSAFVHGLVGGATGRTNLQGFSDSGLTFGAGGGMDIDVSRRFAARVQFDQLLSFTDILENNRRVGVGVVVRFGGL